MLKRPRSSSNDSDATWRNNTANESRTSVQSTYHKKHRRTNEAHYVAKQNNALNSGHNKVTNNSTIGVRLLSTERETDPHRLSQRQKQIDYGKNTLGYDRYCTIVPKHARKSTDPMTPDKTKIISKKRFDAKIRAWRQALHAYDPVDPHQSSEIPPIKDNLCQNINQSGTIDTTVLPLNSCNQGITDTSAATTESYQATNTESEWEKDLAALDPSTNRQNELSIYDNFDEEKEYNNMSDDDDLL